MRLLQLVTTLNVLIDYQATRGEGSDRLEVRGGGGGGGRMVGGEGGKGGEGCGGYRVNKGRKWGGGGGGGGGEKKGVRVRKREIVR